MDLDEAALTPDSCIHRWAIEPPSGDFSHGSCRLCGAERDFPQSPKVKSAYVRVKTR